MASMSSWSSNGSIKAKGPALTTACVAAVPRHVKATIGVLPEGASGRVGEVKMGDRGAPPSYGGRQAEERSEKNRKPSVRSPHLRTIESANAPQADPSTRKKGAEYGASGKRPHSATISAALLGNSSRGTPAARASTYWAS